MLAVLKKQLLEQRIKGRGKETVQRRAKRYLRNFDAIWALQDMLLAEADQEGVAIIANEDKETAVRDVMITIVDKLEGEFKGKPKDVFGVVYDEVDVAIPDEASKERGKGLQILKTSRNWFRSRNG